MLAPWRREALGLPAEPETKGPYDLVVIGGGYSRMAAAISAVRMGLKVALVQDRGVLGGNDSSDQNHELACRFFDAVSSAA